MILIGITGRKGSGKDTAFLGIQQWAEGRGLLAAERGFADKLKWAAARLFWPELDRVKGLNWGNAVKNADMYGEYVFHQVYRSRDGQFTDDEINAEVTGRQLLQRLGTEVGREIFGEDFWVDQLLPLGPEFEPWLNNFLENNKVPDFGVITDLRFENEAKRIKEMGGVIWEIDRELPPTDGHLSEQPLPREMIDKVIKNTGTIADLIHNVRCELTGDYHMRFVPPPEETA